MINIFILFFLSLLGEFFDELCGDYMGWTIGSEYGDVYLLIYMLMPWWSPLGIKME